MSSPLPTKPSMDEAKEDDSSLDEPVQAKFSPEEEAKLVAESNTRKTEANALFSSAKYTAAITKYDEAVAVCPNYLDFEIAVLKSNVAACHLKLEEWKEAIASATEVLSGLDKLERASKEAADAEQVPAEEAADDGEVEEEIVSEGASKAAPAPPAEATDAEAALRKRQEDVLRIRAKALMRRARARSELGGWSFLSAAEEDYKTLSAMTNLTPADRKVVQSQLRVLPPRAKAAQEKEMGEMWGKLKELGNGILKPFGLSTDNFQMQQDGNTGGYSMNFRPNEGGS